MYESEILKPTGMDVDYNAGYSYPELYMTTGNAVLYRVRKAGKYFIIKTPKDCNGQVLAVLQREYELSLGKAHPNIVSVFTYEHDTVVGPGIVMEYVDGRTLSDFIAGNPSMALRVRVFTQLLQAVAYLHRCGVVHNDIKPENILVTHADNDVRLIDFGLADSDAYYMARTLGCTPAYASPELLAREKNIDARSDIYSLGVVMCELFGSKHSRIAARCMRANKEKRYANVEELHAAFKRSRTPLKALTQLLVALLFLVPSFYYIKEYMSDRRRVAECDAMIARIEQDVTDICAATLDSIAGVPYSEFAANHIMAFYQVVGKYQADNVASVTDPQLSTVITSVYMKKLDACQTLLWQQSGKLPSLYKSGLPVNAVVYYDSLVTHRLPFVPFPFQ